MMATILYEDSLAGSDPRRFGLHRLVVSLVNDLVNDSLLHLRRDLERRLQPVPLGGNSKVLDALRDDYSDFPVKLAVLDEDKIRQERRVSLPPDAAIGSVLTRLEAVTRCSRPSIILLVKNVETIVRAPVKWACHFRLKSLRTP